MPTAHLPVSLGLDFGTESVRALLLDTAGNELGIGVAPYAHGQIIDQLPHNGQKLPPLYALQCPSDWLDSAARAIRIALQQSATDANRVIGIGVDFTSCTMLPTLRDGTPLCLLSRWANEPLAWPKLWKHHGAISQTARMNQIAKERGESFLKRYGGVIGLEWFFPKVLETIELAPNVADAAEVWLEAGDWLVWQLVGGPAEHLPRSTCQAGYKGLWAPETGYASADYLRAVDERLWVAASDRMPGRMLSPGATAGALTAELAARLGLCPGIAVSAAIIDAHAAVPGVGAAEPGALVMVMGTSSCHMLNSQIAIPIDGIAGMVEGGILPGLVGYETGQAAVGDAFAWLLKLLGQESFGDLGDQAIQLPPGAEGVTCVDWMNGCRTPLMDGELKGAFLGLSLHTTKAHLYRALLEASAYGLRWIVELLQSGGVAVDRLIATGGLPHHNPQLLQIYADVLQREIEVHPSPHGPAAGAAVLGMFAAGQCMSGFDTLQEAAKQMAAVRPENQKFVQPLNSEKIRAAYEAGYQQYRRLAGLLATHH